MRRKFHVRLMNRAIPPFFEKPAPGSRPIVEIIIPRNVLPERQIGMLKNPAFVHAPAPRHSILCEHVAPRHTGHAHRGPVLVDQVEVLDRAGCAATDPGRALGCAWWDVVVE